MWRKGLILVLTVFLLVGTGCTAFTMKGGKVVPKSTQPIATATMLTPTPSQLPIIITATPRSSAIAEITATTAVTVEPTLVASLEQPTEVMVITHTAVSMATQPASGQTLQIYLVAIGDNGASGQKFGCDDSLVAVDVVVAPTVAVLRTALNELLALKSDYYGQSGLYNALYQSNLKIDQLGLQNGLASVYLTGDLMLGGTCDSPRVEQQIRATALQFSTVTDVEIFLNGKPLGEALWQK